MNPYDNATGWHNSAINEFNYGNYQQSIYMSCLAIELYLKSRLFLVEHSINLEATHDVINIYKVISDVYGKDSAIGSAMSMVRKYANEARYPSLGVIFDSDLANRFLSYVTLVKNYVDLKCVVTQQDLLDNFNRK